MLEQADANRLIDMDKILLECNTIKMPGPDNELNINAISSDKTESFLFDIRRGKIDIRKYKMQNRYSNNEILLRLEIVSIKQFHINPDGTKIYGPHIHRYKEGAGDGWATPYNKQFNDFADYIIDFFKMCNVVNLPNVQRGFDNDVFTG